MIRILLALVATLLCVVPTTAWANSITHSNSITDGGVGSVGYTTFRLDTDDILTIETFSTEFDPAIYVFRADGSYAQVGFDDDSGSPAAFGGNNALVNDFFEAGDYIVAVSDYFLSPEDALAGINTAQGVDGNAGFGSYDLVITTTSPDANVSLVPEPASMVLLGSGLVAAVGMHRRKRRANKPESV